MRLAIIALVPLLLLSGCSWREDLRTYLAEKTGEVVNQATEQAKDEFRKQMENAIDDVRQTAQEGASDTLKQAEKAVSGLAEERLNQAREQVQRQASESLQKAAVAIKPSPKPSDGAAGLPAESPTQSGTFAYLNYTAEAVSQAATTTTFLFFYDERDALARALDAYFTSTLDPVQQDVNVLRINVTRDRSLAERYGIRSFDELVRVDAAGKALSRIQAPAYATTPLLSLLFKAVATPGG